jgi:hypothetical protein
MGYPPQNHVKKKKVCGKIPQVMTSGIFIRKQGLTLKKPVKTASFRVFFPRPKTGILFAYVICKGGI